ncbi:Hypothetical_protein [Hexamita inflata]|uniref:Hypothetical_protein n=1 Tax=Hexamita inflata TaxID=28002 RepID=A0AA86V1D3_9EUKA|nr:Hypothetical protein HINF_LOCUS64409 [Hexamita inflata]
MYYTLITLQTYYHNHQQNLPKLQIPVLEKLSSTELNTIITPYKNSVKSDSLDLLSNQELKQTIIEQINNCNYQLRVQIKRIMYLKWCNEKNQNVINKVQTNMQYLQKRSQ